jgi:hypothetical protein
MPPGSGNATNYEQCSALVEAPTIDGPPGALGRERLQHEREGLVRRARSVTDGDYSVGRGFAFAQQIRREPFAGSAAVIRCDVSLELDGCQFHRQRDSSQQPHYDPRFVVLSWFSVKRSFCTWAEPGMVRGARHAVAIRIAGGWTIRRDIADQARRVGVASPMTPPAVCGESKPRLPVQPLRRRQIPKCAAISPLHIGNPESCCGRHRESGWL